MCQRVTLGVSLEGGFDGVCSTQAFCVCSSVSSKTIIVVVDRRLRLPCGILDGGERVCNPSDHDSVLGKLKEGRCGKA